MEKKHCDIKLLGDIWSREKERREQYDNTVLKTVIGASCYNKGCRMKEESIPLWVSLCKDRTPFDAKGEHESIWKEVEDWLVEMETNQIIITENVSLSLWLDVLTYEK
jgi:hypothetical protein